MNNTPFVEELLAARDGANPRPQASPPPRQVMQGANVQPTQPPPRKGMSLSELPQGDFNEIKTGMSEQVGEFLDLFQAAIDGDPDALQTIKSMGPKAEIIRQKLADLVEKMEGPEVAAPFRAPLDLSSVTSTPPPAAPLPQGGV